MVVTNNFLVKSNFEDTEFVEGDFLDVLNYVREKVYSGYILVSHPLGASIRMLFSPVRSVIIEKYDIDLKKSEALFDESRRLIDESIERYVQIIGKRNPDTRNTRDYEKIDYILLKSAIEEIDFINNIKRGETFEVRA